MARVADTSGTAAEPCDGAAALLCAKCDYDLRGSGEREACPECGFPIARSRELALPLTAGWRRRVVVAAWMMAVGAAVLVLQGAMATWLMSEQFTYAGSILTAYVTLRPVLLLAGALLAAAWLMLARPRRVAVTCAIWPDRLRYAVLTTMTIAVLAMAPSGLLGVPSASILALVGDGLCLAGYVLLIVAAGRLVGRMLGRTWGWWVNVCAAAIAVGAIGGVCNGVFVRFWVVPTIASSGRILAPGAQQATWDWLVRITLILQVPAMLANVLLVVVCVKLARRMNRQVKAARRVS